MNYLRMVILLGVLIFGGVTWAQEDSEGIQNCTEDEFDEIYDLVTEFSIIENMDTIIELFETGTDEDIYMTLAYLYSVRDIYMKNVTIFMPQCAQASDFDRHFLRYHSILLSNVNALVLGTLADSELLVEYSVSLEDELEDYYTLYYFSWSVIEIVTGNYEGDD